MLHSMAAISTRAPVSPITSNPVKPTQFVLRLHTLEIEIDRKSSHSTELVQYPLAAVALVLIFRSTAVGCFSAFVRGLNSCIYKYCRLLVRRPKYSFVKLLKVAHHFTLNITKLTASFTHRKVGDSELLGIVHTLCEDLILIQLAHLRQYQRWEVDRRISWTRFPPRKSGWWNGTSRHFQIISARCLRSAWIKLSGN